MNALRTEIDELLAQGEGCRARALMYQLWESDPASTTAAYIMSRRERLRESVPLQRLNVAILRSFTVEPLVPALGAAALVHGIDLDVHVGRFNAYSQDILDPDGALYAFAPDVVILAVGSRDAAPDLWNDFVGLPGDAVDAAVRRTVGSFETCVKTLRARTSAHVVVHALEVPAMARAGVLDAQSEHGQVRTFRRINEELLRIVRAQPGMFLLDYDALVARCGRARWHDERKWLTVRMPVASAHMLELVDEWLRFLVPLSGRGCKALVVDLDNTLWGGVIGEDGMHGITLGGEYPGALFQQLQLAARDLLDRGVILGICSKNNQADALEVLKSHPGMVLRPEHFAAVRINWQDKAQNLREMAAELNIGLDAIAFLDDNAAERQRIRLAIPEMTVLELPDDPSRYAEVLRRTPVFERLALSNEDRDRGRYYAEQRRRTELEQSAGSLEEYYRSLQMTAEITGLTADTVARAAQLTQKTNQFNLTTRRYTEQQMAQLASAPDWGVYLLRLRDRFGDNGIVGLAIVNYQGEAAQIDTFLLSCRVIGRRADTALLATISEDARARGGRRLIGRFVPTRKNAPAQGFYSGHGFGCTAHHADGSDWEFDLTTQEITPPEFIPRHVLLTEVIR